MCASCAGHCHSGHGTIFSQGSGRDAAVDIAHRPLVVVVASLFSRLLKLSTLVQHDDAAPCSWP